MDIEVIKKLIRKYQSGHTDFVRQAEKAKAYYRNETDIMFPPLKEKQEKNEKPLRNADNRIPFNFHGLLVNQKASYMFAAPPIFDLGNKDANKKLTQFLGDKYPKVCKDLCIEASNCTVAWLHVWKDGKGAWKYAVVPAEQIIPVWTSDLEKELSGVFRSYQSIDEETGDRYTVYEYWNDKECTAYRLKAGDELDQLIPYQMFLVDPELCEYSDCYQHGVGEVPFFPFFNNNIDTDDLKNIKPLIDTYCKVFSGFVNDLEDIQEVIFVLTNYGGEDLGQFLRDLKDYKAIQIESDGDGDHSGVSTCVFYSTDDMQKITDAAYEHRTFHTTYCNSLKIWVEATETAEELQEIYYGADVPETYQSDVLKAYLKAKESVGGTDESEAVR